MITARRFLLLPMLVLLSACVTINIYFPAAAAEKAADRIIQDVWGEQPPGQTAPGEEKTPESTAPDKSSALSPGWRQSALALLLDWALPPAHAAGADIDISTPAIRRIQDDMKRRHERLEAYYASGAIGVTRDALVAIHDPKAVPLQARNEVKQLVAEENRDRQALYAEIARANGHPEWTDQIRDTFAQRWADNARQRGWWHQDSGGAWRR
ncbi:MAG: YdbL family protein [Gammaproteobacteria bacterium]|nr:YdbL family protein [Gammaproteobacteria bacterium]